VTYDAHRALGSISQQMLHGEYHYMHLALLALFIYQSKRTLGRSTVSIPLSLSLSLSHSLTLSHTHTHTITPEKCIDTFVSVSSAVFLNPSLFLLYIPHCVADHEHLFPNIPLLVDELLRLLCSLRLNAFACFACTFWCF